MEFEEQTRPNFRQAGKQLQGRLVKGAVQDPINKNTSASIPYKFETILYKNTNPKGFGGSAQRVSRQEDMAPGPGSYNYEKSYDKSGSTSYSKKGFGNGFISQTNRILYRGFANTGPGPGSYSLKEKPFTVTHISHDPTKSDEESSKPKTTPLMVPGPGAYNPDNVQTSSFGNPKIVNSVFRSSTGREFVTAQSNPPPGAYEIQRNIIAQKPFQHLMNSANFMLPSGKKVSKEVEDKNTVNRLLEKKDEKAMLNLGPGEYFKNDNDDEILLFNQKLKDRTNANFMIGNVTRFGEVIQKKVKRIENPGPGTYVEPVESLPEKTLVSGAVFMSETARKPFKEVKNFIGPMKYNPELLPKKSYHLNINKMWV